MEISIPVIHTDRLVLRGFTEDDTEPLFAMLQDPDVVRYIGDRRIPTRQETWRAIAGYLGHWALRGHGLWAVEERASGELVGRIGILNPLEWPGTEVAYTLGKPWWGRGFATEGARAAMDWGFENLGVDELISLIDPDNAASLAVATRLGERLKGEHDLWGNRVLVYAIGRDEWETGRSRTGRPRTGRPDTGSMAR
jgi:RimJ/RimL family protein N-acetyltransferase